MISKKRECYLCHSQRNLQVHHCLTNANRKQCDKQGLTVYLCMDCHTGSNGVHNSNTQGLKDLKIVAQRKFEETHTRAEFMKLFHKNYIMEEE